MTKILFVSGSLRKASASSATVRALMDALEDEASCQLADIRAIPHYCADDDEPAAAAAFRCQIEAADLVVFVTPEYNYSVPGVLKNAIDWASRPAYASVFKDKRCLVISVSGGALGGVRAQAHLKYILNGMLADVVRGQEIVIPHANAKVEDGVMTDEGVLEFALTGLRAALPPRGKPGLQAVS